MDKIRLLANKLKSITVQQQEEAILGIIRRHEAVALDYNLSQLQAGEDIHGKELEPEYSERTIRVKEAKGQPTDRVTLFDEGDFYRGFLLEADEFPVFFNSDDLKSGMLAERYGDIFGLNEKNLDEFRDIYLVPDIKDYYRQLLRV